MSTGVELLLNYERKLVEGLAKTDLPKLSQDLKRYRVITREMMKAFTSLDHDRLDSRTRARYLLHLVSVRVKLKDTHCIKFLTVLGEVSNERVAKIGRALAQILTMDGTEACITAENKLAEQDVGYLMDILSKVSYKWEEISIALKLPKACIEECRNARNNKLRLHETLTEWVCDNHKHAKPPTLTDLREALASDTVQLWRLAGEIEERLKEKMTCSENPLLKDQQLQIQYESNGTKVADGKSALLEVQVCPRESVSYQWMKDGQFLFESSSFSGTHSAMLFMSQVTQGMEGEYCCHVSHGSEKVTGSPVAVTVKYSKVKKYLLDLYTSQSEIPQDSWPLFSPNHFVDLSLIKANKLQNTEDNFFVQNEIEAILEIREKVKYEDAFSDYESGALLLVEGRPGSGKTTLAHKITKDWAKGTILKNVHMVFLISLRNDLEKSELFKTFFQSQSKVFQKKVEESRGDRVCFILDGYDEYSPRQRHKSVINQLIHNKYLPLAMTIVTSRPSATTILRPKATRRIEILGFTKQQFFKFINSYPFDNFINSAHEIESTKSKLMTYLKACTNVLNMCYLPINASIICFLYSKNLGDNMPKTETQIYESFVIAIILRKLRLDDPYIQLHSLKDLEGVDKECFSLICLLAFKMTIESKQIVHELPMSLDSLNSSPFHGLLTIDRTAKLFGLEDVVTFLHLTLQEYLAAYHLASLNEDQQMTMIILYSGKDHMLTTFKFYCGLVNMKHKISQFDEITNVPDLLYRFHCAYETQEETVCYRAMELQQSGINIGFGVLTPADFTVLGYVISTASILVNFMFIPNILLYEEYIDDNWKNKELDNTDLLAYTFENTAAKYFTNIKLFTEVQFCSHISYNLKTHDKLAGYILEDLFEQLNFYDFNGQVGAVKELMEGSSDIFSSDSALPLADALKQCTNLQKLRLKGNYKSIKTARVIANVLKGCKDLREFKIHGTMPSSSAVVLVNAIQNCKNLHKLNLNSIDLSSNVAMTLARGLTHSSLKQLSLVNCNISPEGAEAIATGLTDISLELLDIKYNNIGYKGAVALANKFHIYELNISYNNIGSEGTKALARGLLQSPILTGLHHESNNIDSSSMLTLAEGLLCCTDLQFLNLSNNDVGPEGAAVLARGLRSCTHLQFILLQHCNLSLNGIVVLTESLHCWRKLTHLNLSDNGIIMDGAAVLLAGAIQLLNLLEKLYLSNNSINPSSAIALAEGIQFCPLLHTLDMFKNTIGSAGAVALAGGLKCMEMKFINLSHNNIDIKSVEALATLVQYSRLQRLDLSHNNINSTGGLILITELISCVHPLRLNLQVNNISPKATKFLTAMLHRNTNIRVLLSSNSQPS